MKTTLPSVKAALFSCLIIVGVSIKTDAQWSQLGGINATFNGDITSLTIDFAGNVYVAGDFTNGSSINSGNRYVAKWNGIAWIELGGTTTSTFNSNIISLVTDTFGNVYAAGDFTNDYGKKFVAKWNGSNWSELGGANTSTFNNEINSLATDAEGNVYAVGDFTNGNGKNYVAKWNGSNWIELGGTNTSTFNGNIYSITIDSYGNIYAAGSFTNDNGNAYVAKWNGSAWSELGSTNVATFNYYINSLTTDVFGNVYATDGSYVAEWNGSSWISVGLTIPCTVADNEFNSLTIDDSGNIYVADRSIVERWNVTSWNIVSCSEVTTFGSGSDYLNTIATDASGNIYAAGLLYNSNYKNYVAVSKTSFKQPTINFFTPTTATGGTLVTISGNNLSDAEWVCFGGISAASLTVVDSTTIIASVGNGSSGSIYVITPFSSAHIDGFTYTNSSNITGLANENLIGKSNSIQISPNPANSVITLTTHLSKGEITIHDLGGKQVLQSQLSSNQTQLDISSLSKGVYLVSVLSDTEKLTGKLVVE